MNENLRAAARKLDRYSETPGLGLFKAVGGEWLRRADVLALVDGLDVLRDHVACGKQITLTVRIPDDLYARLVDLMPIEGSEPEDPILA